MANRLTCPLSCWSPWGPPSLDLLLTLAPFTFLAKVMGFLCSAQGLLILLIVLEGGWTTAQPSVVGSSVRAWPTLGDEPHFSVWPLKHSKQSIPHEFTRQSVTVEVPSTGREGLTVLGTALSISPGWVFLVFQYFPSDIFVHILLSFFLGFYVFGLFLKFQKKFPLYWRVAIYMSVETTDFVYLLCIPLWHWALSSEFSAGFLGLYR